MKVYIAGSWHNREALKSIRNTLRFYGHFVTSRWLDVDENTDAYESAIMDKADIEAADVVAVFMDVPSSKGGLHVEFGMAIGMKKRVIAVGSHLTLAASHVFCSLPEVRRVLGLDGLLALLAVEPIGEAV